jgi:hypothetical protein
MMNRALFLLIFLLAVLHNVSAYSEEHNPLASIIPILSKIENIKFINKYSGAYNMSINKNQLKNLITETLKESGLYSKAAVNLLLGTAAQESHLGRYIRQLKGPALGIFQMEPRTHDDIWENFLKYKLKKIEPRFKVGTVNRFHTNSATPDALVFDLKYAIIMCRLHYFRVSERLPKHDDIEGLARYWKRHYNTKHGRGTEKEFVFNYGRFVS